MSNFSDLMDEKQKKEEQELDKSFRICISNKKEIQSLKDDVEQLKIRLRRIWTYLEQTHTENREDGVDDG